MKRPYTPKLNVIYLIILLYFDRYLCIFVCICSLGCRDSSFFLDCLYRPFVPCLYNKSLSFQTISAHSADYLSPWSRATEPMEQTISAYHSPWCRVSQPIVQTISAHCAGYLSPRCRVSLRSSWCSKNVTPEKFATKSTSFSFGFAQKSRKPALVTARLCSVRIRRNSFSQSCAWLESSFLLNSHGSKKACSDQSARETSETMFLNMIVSIYVPYENQIVATRLSKQWHETRKLSW